MVASLSFSLWFFSTSEPCLFLLKKIKLAYSVSVFVCFFQPMLQKWSVIGKLPFRVKTTLTGFWDGWLYFTSGQRDRGPDNPQPQKVIRELWRTKLSALL